MVFYRCLYMDNLNALITKSISKLCFFVIFWMLANCVYIITLFPNSDETHDKNTSDNQSKLK